ncbi:MAG: polyamine aminopropyltransferase [Bdellovibrio sp.]|nr:polyamine aminopropyltransferase [Methylotenera sp.]
MFGLNKKIHKSVRNESIVEVTETNGIRSLHLGSVTVQSSMKVKAPFALELAYTRGMMGFLLFSNAVKNVLTIGLGGGSVPKYIWQNCPDISQTIIEINPQTINIARSHFAMPANDARLNVIEGDGLVYLADNPNSADCLMIDAFDAHGIPSDFCSQDFFDICALTLTKNGIFAINLWGSDKNFDVYLQRIERSFNNQTLMLPTGKPGNIVVFGFKNNSLEHSPDLKITNLREHAKKLESHHQIEFLSFIDKLCDHNSHNNKQFFWNTLDRFVLPK